MKNKTKKILGVFVALSLLSVLAFGMVGAEATERAFLDENGKLHIKYYDNNSKLVNEVIRDWDNSTLMFYGLTIPN